jgi:sterol desaturase/sphingolipid hydroxylase (fatty acid hydroxylase superfamily)
MKLETLAQFVVRLADLAEAEGRAVRASAFRLLTAAAIFLVAAAAGTSGAALILLAVFWLVRPAGPVPAALVTGVFALAVGGGLLWIARQMDQ